MEKYLLRTAYDLGSILHWDTLIHLISELIYNTLTDCGLVMVNYGWLYSPCNLFESQVYHSRAPSFAHILCVKKYKKLTTYLWICIDFEENSLPRENLVKLRDTLCFMLASASAISRKNLDNLIRLLARCPLVVPTF